MEGKIERRVLSGNDDFNWPTKTWDLTSLYYFPWCYVKNLIKKNKRQFIPSLKDEIISGISERDKYTKLPLKILTKSGYLWSYKRLFIPTYLKPKQIVCFIPY